MTDEERADRITKDAIDKRLRELGVHELSDNRHQRLDSMTLPERKVFVDRLILASNGDEVLRMIDAAYHEFHDARRVKQDELADLLGVTAKSEMDF